jgi:hypothetical protein
MNRVRALFAALAHFTLFEKPRFAFFEEIRRFLRE